MGAVTWYDHNMKIESLGYGTKVSLLYGAGTVLVGFVSDTFQIGEYNYVVVKIDANSAKQINAWEHCPIAVEISCIQQILN